MLDAQELAEHKDTQTSPVPLLSSTTQTRPYHGTSRWTQTEDPEEDFIINRSGSNISLDGTGFVERETAVTPRSHASGRLRPEQRTILHGHGGPATQGCLDQFSFRNCQ